MADTSKDAPAPQAKTASPAMEAAAKATKPQGNPVFRMMGLPNFRFKLPSRNWMIFLTITGSWTAALVYDRREKKRVQKKWCDLVSHLSQEPLPTSALRRKVVIYLSAPPADGLLAAREHFHEYIKPILVAAALDWDVVEGRREGDVRAGLAERIRKLRKMKGEPSQEPLEEDEDLVVRQTRERAGFTDEEGVQGDIVVGRHTWKEYIRGLHEGWLGPLDAPPPPVEEQPALEATPDPAASASEPPAASDLLSSTPSQPSDDASPTAPSPSTDSTTPPPPADPPKEEAKPAKRKQPPPFIYPSDYSTATPSPNLPSELPPSNTIPLPHILGFLNTPLRMYRFLHRRVLADDIGRDVAAAVLAYNRPYYQVHENAAVTGGAGETIGLDTSAAVAERGQGESWEQQGLLRQEEQEWHKSVRKREAGERESVWLDPVALDPRIAERMRRFVLYYPEEQRAMRIAKGEEGPITRETAAEREG
ncbi:mitochondrial import inner membrane translocase subunit tim54 [Coniosporium apollinis]|uniref:Mitochondrial import inner membrane translocase subunit TIM54 n=1 Tax=Coniosporium apollinis TaxID=61459 RepID=A0ABQ9P0L8_9PEZI|nr:mitochondrial import inner membrane translocase subunit tim54 [Coniosporium apollinis]